MDVFALVAGKSERPEYLSFHATEQMANTEAAKINAHYGEDYPVTVIAVTVREAPPVQYVGDNSTTSLLRYIIQTAKKIKEAGDYPQGYIDGLVEAIGILSERDQDLGRMIIAAEGQYDVPRK